MRRYLNCFSVFLLVVTLSPWACATPISGSGGGFSGSGTLTTSSNGDGSYTITAITGSASGVDFLFAPGTFQNNDNQLFPSGPSLVDTRGFAFQDTQGNTTYMVDILRDAGSSTGYSASLFDSDGQASVVDVTLSLAGAPTASFSVGPQGAAPIVRFDFSFSSAAATTPEPSSLLLFGTGLLGGVRFIRGRRPC